MYHYRQSREAATERLHKRRLTVESMVDSLTKVKELVKQVDLNRLITQSLLDVARQRMASYIDRLVLGLE